MVGWYVKEYESIFNIWSTLTLWLGQSSAFIFLVVLFFASLYLTLRISYRTLFAKVRESVPSLRNMREAVLPTDEDDDEIPVRKSKLDDAYKKKAEELEQKLREIQKGKKTETPIHEPKGAALL